MHGEYRIRNSRRAKKCQMNFNHFITVRHDSHSHIHDPTIPKKQFLRPRNRTSANLDCHPLDFFNNKMNLSKIKVIKYEAKMVTAVAVATR